MKAENFLVQLVCTALAGGLWYTYSVLPHAEEGMLWEAVCFGFCLRGLAKAAIDLL